jgi:selenium metabolism protein YedF
MKEIDARGEPCPQPVLLAKRAMKTQQPFSILVDGSGQAENIQRAVSRAGADCFIDRLSRFDRVTVTVAAEAVFPKTGVPGSKLVVSVPHDSFGSGGDPMLEEVLGRAYFHTLTELDKGLPDTLIFYDKGVFLTLHDSHVLEDITALEQKGVTILVCGTCLKHFNVLKDLAVGSVSNMYEIAEELGTAERFYSI